MKSRRKKLMDIRELLIHIRANPSDRGVAAAMGMNRATVKKYRGWAEEQGLLEGALPPMDALKALLDETLASKTPPQNVSSVEPYREVVAELRKMEVEMAAILERLKERGYTGSYASVRRFVKRLEVEAPEAFVRIETKPGEEAQVDFGSAGVMIDPATGKLRKTWVFVMTLSWCRHQYAEFVFDQRVETWLLCHRRAFEYFGGVPERVVIDNLKAAIVRACWEDPQVQHSYRECAEHYGFLIGPCKPRHPRHKGKVEQGGVHYVKRNFLGGRKPTTITQANQDVRVWCEQTAGRRVHGTTKEQPLVRFETVEQAQLKPLPATPYDPAVWKVAKVARDCYVTFDKAYYSVPFRLVGQQVQVRAGLRDVGIFTLDFEPVATHTRASKPGERQTNLDHLPPDKVRGLTLTRETCRAQAAAIGPATAAVVERMLNDNVLDRMRVAGKLLALTEHFGAARLEAACERALRFDDPAYWTIKRILARNLDAAPTVSPSPIPAAEIFVRGAEELVGHLFDDLEGATWN
jgi:transposase